MSTDPRQERTLGQLVASATQDISALVRSEIALAKAEIAVQAKKAGVGGGLLAGAAVVALLLGLLHLHHARRGHPGDGAAPLGQLPHRHRLHAPRRRRSSAWLGVRKMKTVQPSPDKAIGEAQQTVDGIKAAIANPGTVVPAPPPSWDPRVAKATSNRARPPSARARPARLHGTPSTVDATADTIRARPTRRATPDQPDPPHPCPSTLPSSTSTARGSTATSPPTAPASTSPSSVTARSSCMLHGFPQFWYAWRHQMVALADAGYRVAAIDLRGYGGSDKPPRGYDTYMATPRRRQRHPRPRREGGGRRRPGPRRLDRLVACRACAPT